MSDFTLVDIFFVITGAAVVVVSIVIIVLVLYIISFIRTIKQIATTANRAAELISEDAAALRNNIKAKGFNIAALFTFLKSMSKLKNIKGKK